MAIRADPDSGPLALMEILARPLYSFPRAPIRMAMMDACVGLTSKLSCSTFQLMSSKTLPGLASLSNVLIASDGSATEGWPAWVADGTVHNDASKIMLVSNLIVWLKLILLLRTSGVTAAQRLPCLVAVSVMLAVTLALKLLSSAPGLPGVKCKVGSSNLALRADPPTEFLAFCTGPSASPISMAT